MYIFLDTNVYFNNWFLKSPSFEKLSQYCNNNDATLLVSEVIVNEVEAKFIEETDKALKQLDEARRACKNVGYGGVPKVDSFDSSYDFREVLKENITNIIFLPYDTIPHRLLVAKAIGAKRPFNENEKGYRDALIWHSLLDFLKMDKFGTSVAFVTENSSDFFDNKSESIQFYKDLLNDLRNAKVANRFLLFRNLRQFVDTNKIITSDGIDRERLIAELLPTIESSAEDAAIDYLNGLSTAATQSLFSTAGFSPQAVPLLLAANWEIFEGTEDAQILSAELLDKDKAYVSYDFNLRNVTSYWNVRAVDFLQNKKAFDDAFWNVKIDSEIVHAETVARCYFKSSFIIDLAKLEIMESSIDSAWLREYF